MGQILSGLNHKTMITLPASLFVFLAKFRGQRFSLRRRNPLRFITPKRFTSWKQVRGTPLSFLLHATSHDKLKHCDITLTHAPSFPINTTCLRSVNQSVFRGEPTKVGPPTKVLLVRIPRSFNMCKCVSTMGFRAVKTRILLTSVIRYKTPLSVQYGAS